MERVMTIDRTDMSLMYEFAFMMIVAMVICIILLSILVMDTADIKNKYNICIHKLGGLADRFKNYTSKSNNNDLIYKYSSKLESRFDILEQNLISHVEQTTNKFIQKIDNLEHRSRSTMEQFSDIHLNNINKNLVDIMTKLNKKQIQYNNTHPNKKRRHDTVN